MKNAIVALMTLTLLSFAQTANAQIGFQDLLARPRPVATKYFSYGSAPDQTGELWLPDGPGPYPVVIILHGGCWLEALPGVELMAYVAEDLRRHGIAVWNVEYRRLGTMGAGYPGTFLDIANGTDYLRKIAQENHLDLTRLIIVGHSAGGQLALWDAARQRITPASPLYTAHPLPVKAVVTLAGINDLSAYRQSGPSACGGQDTIDQLIGAPLRKGDAYADTSPAAMLPLGVRQLIISGENDPIVPPVFGKNYALKAKNSGDAVDEMSMPAAGHFELIDPTTQAWAAIRAWILSHI
jgi:acetyl esterase/lipase